MLMFMPTRISSRVKTRPCSQISHLHDVLRTSSYVETGATDINLTPE